MSPYQLKNVIDKELEKLNATIDLKIIEGESYRRDAQRHKMLLSQIKHIRRKQWLKRSMRFMSLF
jgi:hypothetical protein